MTMDVDVTISVTQERVRPLVLALLTWLSFRASNTDAERFDRALAALDRFALVESALQRDVLSARAGMLRNYDPLVREVNVLNELIVELQDAAAADAEEVAAVGQYVGVALMQLL